MPNRENYLTKHFSTQIFDNETGELIVKRDFDQYLDVRGPFGTFVMCYDEQLGNLFPEGKYLISVTLLPMRGNKKYYSLKEYFEVIE